MAFEQILVEADGPLTWLTLNRPSEANAMSLLLAQEFCTAIERAEEDEDCHVLILQGAGKFFCAGGDISMMAGAPDSAEFLGGLAAKMHEGLLRLAHSRLITIAVVNGYAAGAGLGLVLNADIVLATPNAAFRTAYEAVGLTPDCGLSYLLPQIVGQRRAVQMSLLGHTASAGEGRAWGIVTEEVAEEDLVQRARELGEKLGAGPTQILGPTKRLLAGRRADDYARHLADEASTITAMVAHPDTQKRLAAFLATRRK